MRIVTFNIRYGEARDGPNSWPYRSETLFELVKSFRAEVVCLQEALKFQMEELARALDGYRWIGIGRDDGVDAGEFVPLFLLNTVPEPKAWGSFWFSETPEVAGSIGWTASQSRICTWAKWSGLGIFNLHLDHMSEEARARSVELLLSRLADSPEETIVCGDFNDVSDSRAVRLMVEAGFADLGASAGPTFNDFLPIAPQDSRIDYVFRRGGVGEASARVVREPLCSDHWPVVADIPNEDLN